MTVPDIHVPRPYCYTPLLHPTATPDYYTPPKGEYFTQERLQHQLPGSFNLFKNNNAILGSIQCWLEYWQWHRQEGGMSWQQCP